MRLAELVENRAYGHSGSSLDLLVEIDKWPAESPSHALANRGFPGAWEAHEDGVGCRRLAW